MKKIIVDTNIIFSCLLNSQGTIGDLVFNSDDVFECYSNEYMRLEIRKHWAPKNFKADGRVALRNRLMKA